MLRPWKAETEADIGLMIDLHCKTCKSYKKGGGLMVKGQHFCQLLWGGLAGTSVNQHTRAAWGIDEATGTLNCRQCSPRPAPGPRRRRPDHEAQTAFDL